MIDASTPKMTRRKKLAANKCTEAAAAAAVKMMLAESFAPNLALSLSNFPLFFLGKEETF